MGSHQNLVPQLVCITKNKYWKDTSSGSLLKATYCSTPHLVMPRLLQHSQLRARCVETARSKRGTLPRARRRGAPSPGPSNASCGPRRLAQLCARGRANSARRSRGAARLGQFREFRAPHPPPPPQQEPRRPPNSRSSLLPTSAPRPGFPPPQTPLTAPFKVNFFFTSTNLPERIVP